MELLLNKKGGCKLDQQAERVFSETRAVSNTRNWKKKSFKMKLINVYLSVFSSVPSPSPLIIWHLFHVIYRNKWKTISFVIFNGWKPSCLHGSPRITFTPTAAIISQDRNHFYFSILKKSFHTKLKLLPKSLTDGPVGQILARVSLVFLYRANQVLPLRFEQFEVV